jgi:hypothetical protein
MRVAVPDKVDKFMPKEGGFTAAYCQIGLVGVDELN